MAEADHNLTSWTLIQAAAEGGSSAREAFARRYLGIVKDYLRKRWGGTPLRQEIDDAAQTVVLECFKPGGVLVRARPDRGHGFRAFLFGVTRNVARNVETRRGVDRLATGVDPSDRETPSAAFDRAWARGVMREAAGLLATWARGGDEKAVRCHDLLMLRFRDGLPIREIARRWEADPDRLHHDYARAREEYRKAIRQVLRNHGADTPEAMRQEWRLLEKHLGS